MCFNWSPHKTQYWSLQGLIVFVLFFFSTVLVNKDSSGAAKRTYSQTAKRRGVVHLCRRNSVTEPTQYIRQLQTGGTYIIWVEVSSPVRCYSPCTFSPRPPSDFCIYWCLTSMTWESATSTAAPLSGALRYIRLYGPAIAADRKSRARAPGRPAARPARYSYRHTARRALSSRPLAVVIVTRPDERASRSIEPPCWLCRHQSRDCQVTRTHTHTTVGGDWCWRHWLYG